MSDNKGTAAIRISKDTYDRMTAMIERSDPKPSYRSIAESALTKYLDQVEQITGTILIMPKYEEGGVAPRKAAEPAPTYGKPSESGKSKKRESA